MSEHPAKGCTKKQREVFERIATGDERPKYANPKTLDALERKGLIEHAGYLQIGVPPVVAFVNTYRVPLNLHAQWCAWCAENCKEDA